MEINPLDTLELHRNLLAQVAAHLAGRAVTIRFVRPFLKGMPGIAYNHLGAAVIDLDPEQLTADYKTHGLRLYLHETAHILLDWGTLQPSTHGNRAPASVDLSPRKRAEFNADPSEDPADALALGWLEYAEQHHMKYPTWSGLRSRLISLLDWKTER